MTWQELADFLQQASDDLFQDAQPSLLSLALSSAEVPAALLEVDKPFQKAVGRAVFEYATTGQWPVLLPDEKVLLFYRLKFGIAIAGSLAAAHTVGGEKLFANPEDKKDTKADLIQSLLEYCWNHAGLPYTHQVCADSILGVPLPPQNFPAN